MGQTSEHAQQPGGGGCAALSRRGGAVRLDVRYFAGAAAAAGLDQEVVLLGDDRGATLAGLLEHLRDVHPALGPVLDVATTLVDELVVSDGRTALREGAQVDVLPPFAGG